MDDDDTNDTVSDAQPAVLPTALRAPLGLVAALSALLVAALGVLYAGDGAGGAVDSWLVDPTADSVGSPWRGIGLAIDFLGEPVGSAVLVAAVVTGCLLLRWPRGAVLVVVAVAVTVGVGTALKTVVGRTIHGPENLSYPSGHTGFLTALALTVALLAAGRLGLGRAAGAWLVCGAALVAGAVMGWAQAALSAHYVTDVLGGWCLALAVVPLTGWLVDRVADARRPATPR
ncbi:MULTISPECIES: phosphatase PAP2 family protein [unclassified Streptomyces]|uniref:phosphatase PAP2 family protein n=1 Tax=unclassified Streptomyces TaxID=2593676 RepID=UPI00278C64CB|nr:MULTISPECIES: phosphatase PAP2 family protein [unclassified Streptomyces]